jgi:hypothetical protein
MAKLDCDLGVSLGMDKFDYALPGVEVFRGVKACTSGEMRPSGETQVISVNTSPAPPLARSA